jgi:hypothetical protein
MHAVLNAGSRPERHGAYFKSQAIAEIAQVRDIPLSTTAAREILADDQ